MSLFLLFFFLKASLNGFYLNQSNAKKFIHKKIGFLDFDPCFKNLALTFLGTPFRLQSSSFKFQYQILIVPKSGVSQINLEGSRARMPQGGVMMSPPVK